MTNPLRPILMSLRFLLRYLVQKVIIQCVFPESLMIINIHDELRGLKEEDSPIHRAW